MINIFQHAIEVKTWAHGAMVSGEAVFEWPDRNYAYVGQDCRGRGRSGGDFSAGIEEIGRAHV